MAGSRLDKLWFQPPCPLRWVLLAVLSSSSALSLNAQYAAAWSGLAYEREVGPKWAWEAEVEYRRTWSDPETNDWLFTLGGSRSVVSRLNLAAALRYRVGLEGAPAELRYVIDPTYSLPLGASGLQLETRQRYQREYPLDGGPVESAWRPRGGLSWEISDRLEAVAEFEWRYRFDRRNDWSGRRATYGFAYAFLPHWKIDVFYRWEGDLNVEAPGYEHIIGVFLRHTSPHREKRDWKDRDPFQRVVW